MKVYVQNQSGPSNGNLHRFCLTRVSTLTSQDYNPSSVVLVSRQSDGSYYPNFVPFFVVLYLNGIKVALTRLSKQARRAVCTLN